MKCTSRCELLCPAVILGLLLGIVQAILWTLGFFSARAIVPYAAAVALLIFGITAIIAFCYRKHCDPCHDPCDEKYSCLTKFVKVVMISAAVFIIIALIIVGTILSLTLKTILAFIGSISFWMMFLAFIAMIIWIARKH